MMKNHPLIDKYSELLSDAIEKYYQESQDLLEFKNTIEQIIKELSSIGKSDLKNEELYDSYLHLISRLVDNCISVKDFELGASVYNRCLPGFESSSMKRT